MPRFIVSNDYWKSKDGLLILQRTIYKSHKSGPHTTDTVFTKRGKDGRVFRITEEEFFENCGEPTKLPTDFEQIAERKRTPQDVVYKVRNLVNAGYDDFGRLNRDDLIALLDAIAGVPKTEVKAPRSKVYIVEDAGDSPGRILAVCATEKRARNQQLKLETRYTVVTTHPFLE